MREVTSAIIFVKNKENVGRKFNDSIATTTIKKYTQNMISSTRLNCFPLISKQFTRLKCYFEFIDHLIDTIVQF